MQSFAVVIAFRPQRAVQGKSVFGKVGPFDDQKETDQWCRSFREVVSKQRMDMTALPDFEINELTSELPALNVLPSRDPEEIINHAVVTTLFGVSA
jgi:hypothetical protein